MNLGVSFLFHHPTTFDIEAACSSSIPNILALIARKVGLPAPAMSSVHLDMNPAPTRLSAVATPYYSGPRTSW